MTKPAPVSMLQAGQIEAPTMPLFMPPHTK